jgi:hypothetical protein
MADSFIGPGVFASGQAILKILPEKPCFVSLLGEIGLTLQQICDPRANGANKMLYVFSWIYIANLDTVKFYIQWCIATIPKTRWRCILHA